MYVGYSVSAFAIARNRLIGVMTVNASRIGSEALAGSIRARRGSPSLKAFIRTYSTLESIKVPIQRAASSTGS